MFWIMVLNDHIEDRHKAYFIVLCPFKGDLNVFVIISLHVSKSHKHIFLVPSS